MSYCKFIQDISREVAESYCPSGNNDTKWHTSGIIDFQAPFNRFVLGPDLPLITEGADEQVGRGRSQHIDRNAAAVLLDWNLRRLSQGKAVIDLKLGELLVQLRKRQPQKLGFVRLQDYTREEMGIPWRSASLLVNNWTALEKLPLLRMAHREGRISKSKLRFLLRIANAENEAAWIEKASKVSVRALEIFVKTEEARRRGDVDAGPRTCTSYGLGTSISQTGLDGIEETRTTWGQAQGPAPTDGAGYLMTLKTTPEKAAIWDFALEHFRGHEGGNFSTTVFIESLLAEFFSALPLPEDDLHSNAVGSMTCSPRAADTCRPRAVSNGGHSSPSTSSDSASVPTDMPLPGGSHCRRITGDEDDELLSGDGKEIDEERERWQALRRDLEDVTKIWEFLSCTPVTVETPLEWDGALEDIRAVAEMIRKTVAMRQLVGFYMGRLLRTFENLHLHVEMQFASLNHYVVERLGVSMRTARNLIKLVRSFLSLPVLEKAFKDGVLTQQRALLLLKVAKEKTEKEWLRYGTEVPVLDLEREVKRLFRLIEANPNLTDAYRVLPGFLPTEKANSNPGSGIEALKDEGSSSDALEKISITPVQMCASEAISDTVKPAPEVPAVQMSATEKLSDAAGPGASDTSLQMCATKTLMDTIDLEASDPSGKICATGADSADITDEPVNLPVPISMSDTASAFSGNSVRSSAKNTATINFFIPDSLIPLWNYAFIRYLEFAAGAGRAKESSTSAAEEIESAPSVRASTEIQLAASHHSTDSDDAGSRLEGFLFSLIYHYLENEHKGLKRMKRRLRHKVIERDGFRCIVPGCSSRAGLDDHHITFRSQGGGDGLPNNTSTCHLHHCQCIHDNRYITIKGQAPDNLTIAMGVEPGKPPFALFVNGRRVNSNLLSYENQRTPFSNTL